MMPVTIGHILKELDRRRFANGMAAIADIADRDRDLVTQALAQAPKGARVDVAVLVETLRREAQERAQTEWTRRRAEANPARYAALLAAQGHVCGFVAGPTASVEEPDPDLEEEPEPRKRTIPRRRPQSVEDASDVRSAPAAPLRPPERASDRASRSAGVFGGRLFDEFGEVTPGPAHVQRPPWLLDPAEDAQPTQPKAAVD